MLEQTINVLNKTWYKNKTYIIAVSALLFLLLIFYFLDNNFFQNIKDILLGRSIIDTSNYSYKSSFVKKKRDSKKTENACRATVEDITGLPFPSMRPDFLNNPKTGRNLECDMMNEDVKLCIERQGIQHYKKNSHYHSETGNRSYEAQRERDILKKKLLEENGYKLIEIPYTVHPDEFGKFLCKNLPSYLIDSGKCETYLNADLYD
jgi:hypothetical protein